MDSDKKRTLEERERLVLLSVLEDERQARLVLKQQQEHYRALVESLNEGLIHVDNDDRVLFVNNRFCQMSGYEAGDLLNKICHEILFDVEVWDDIKKRNRERLSGISEIYEIKLKRKDGRHLWVQVSAAPVFGPQKEIIGSLGLFTDISQEREAKARAEVLEQRYQLFVNSTQDLAFLKDDEFRYLMVNEANQKYFGRPMDEILGRTDFDLMPPKQAEACRRSDRQAVEENRLVINEEVVEDKIFETRKFPVLLEDGRIGVGGIVRDITDRKRYEQLLIEASQNWKITFDAIEDSICLLSADQKVLSCNRTFIRHVGKEYQDVIGRHCYELIHPQGIPATECPFVRMKRSRQRETMEMSVDGRSFDVLVDPIFDEKGEISRAVHLLIESTERKKAARELEASEERFRTFFENTFVGIYRTTPDGRVLMANPAFVRMLGYDSLEELVGRNLEKDGFKPSNLREEFKQLMAQADQVIGYEAPWKRKDGTVIWVRENARCVRDGSGQILYYEGTAEDISRQKEAEFEKELIEKELQQSQKLESIGQLAGGVAHDFNNMLAAILGNAELLLGKLAKDSELAHLVEQIISGVEHAAKLTKQLLTFSRRDQMKKEVLDVHRVISETAEILANTIDRRITIEQHLRASPSTVLADHSLLENALLNLGLNSRDAMPNGGKLIFSTKTVMLDHEYLARHSYKIVPGRYVKIEVTDTGTGIPEEIRPRIFEPFFTTKEPGRGTGLGLASVYGTVKSHGGSIECYSELGHGTTMAIYLPLLEEDSEWLRARGDQMKTILVSSRSTGTILVVDDEEIVRGMIEQILRSQGYKVLTAADGEEGVEKYRTWHREIDLVILDMIMPRKSGREAFLEMKKIRPDVRVILSSGFSEDSEAREILKLGIMGFLQKPFRMDDLLRVVAKVLS